MQEESTALYAKIARRLRKLVAEHGAPNNFGLDELDLIETPLTLANTFRRWSTGINRLLAEGGISAVYVPRKSATNPSHPAHIHVEPLDTGVKAS